MKSRLILLTIVALAEVLSANAQYTFTISGQFYGNCGGNTSQMNAEYNRLLKEYQAQNVTGFDTQQECEQMRLVVNGINYNQTYGRTSCGFKLIAGPCTGRPRGGAGVNAGNVNFQGVNEGTSFFTPSNVTEIQNWEEDYMKKVSGLDQNNQSVERNVIESSDANFNSARDQLRSEGEWFIDLDKPFVPINMREGGTNMVVSNDLKPIPDDLYMPSFYENEILDEIHSLFREKTRINIDEILLKRDKTDEDKRIIEEYNEFKKQYEIEQEKINEMSMFSLLVYHDPKDADLKIEDKLEELGIEHLSLETIDVSEPLYNTALLLEKFNNMFLNGGFHAELFYNKNTNEYSISFRGTEKLDVADLYTDISQSVGGILGVPEQYQIAIQISEEIRNTCLNSDIKVNFTGHSLGGGLATLAGVISGQPTYVFNPAGVNEKTFKAAGVLEKFKNNDFEVNVIKTDDDFLSNYQEGNGFAYASANYVSHHIINTVRGITNPLSFITNDSSTDIPKASGNQQTIHTGGNHFMRPIVQYENNRLDYVHKVVNTDETTQNRNIDIFISD